MNRVRHFFSRHKWVYITLFVVLLSGGIFSFNNDDKRNFEIVKNLDIFFTLFRELNTYYVDETNPEELIKTGIDQMLESLDPYTTFIPESDIDDFKFMTTGEYGGIGALITKYKGDIAISEPYEGFPAQRTGLKAGDVILEIDGVKMQGKNSQEVSEKLKGTPNTVVKVKVQRLGEKKPIDFNITRQKIQIDAVPYYGMLDVNTGIIILNGFTTNCSNDLEKAFLDLRDKRGAKQVIIDLRGNPGGLLDEAIKICNLFIPKGSEIVSTKGKVKQWDKKYNATREPIDTVMPLAVLVNRGSASASEIVSGCLQDYDRAVIIGQRTYGKGLVQATRDLTYNTKLKVTTAKYYIPSGRCIQALDYTHRNEDGSVGLVPDSLISEFKTKHGRKVYDGGGVSPDVKIDNGSYGKLSYALVSQQLIFEYATIFASQNPTIEQAGDFVITDENYNQFKTFVLAQKEFTYKSETQEQLAKLIETAKKEDYYEHSRGEFSALELMIAANVAKDLETYEPEVKELLSNEIIKRYYYQKGSIIQSFKNDEQLKRAIKLVKDKAELDGLLSGTILSHAGDKRK